MANTNLQSASASLRPSDAIQTQANRGLNKVNSLKEFDLESLTSQIDKSDASVRLLDSNEKPQGEDLRKAFQDFIGQTLFSQMISSMRSTQEGAAYFDGGRAEKIFQGQLDQILSEELSEASASKISDPMFKLFQLRRQ